MVVVTIISNRRAISLDEHIVACHVKAHERASLIGEVLAGVSSVVVLIRCADAEFRAPDFNVIFEGKQRGSHSLALY